MRLNAGNVFFFFFAKCQTNRIYISVNERGWRGATAREKIKKLKKEHRILTELLLAEGDKHGVINYKKTSLTELLFSPNWSNLVPHT